MYFATSHIVVCMHLQFRLLSVRTYKYRRTPASTSLDSQFSVLSSPFAVLVQEADSSVSALGIWDGRNSFKVRERPPPEPLPSLSASAFRSPHLVSATVRAGMGALCQCHSRIAPLLHHFTPMPEICGLRGRARKKPQKRVVRLHVCTTRLVRSSEGAIASCLLLPSILLPSFLPFLPCLAAPLSIASSIPKMCCQAGASLRHPTRNSRLLCSYRLSQLTWAARPAGCSEQQQQQPPSRFAGRKEDRFPPLGRQSLTEQRGAFCAFCASGSLSVTWGFW